MSRRTSQDVRLFGVQDRRARAGVTRPWVVRWVVEGRQRAKSFRTKAEADRYRSELYRAIQAGEPFDDRTGLPARWAPSSDDTLVWTWARRWLQEQWSEWQPRTRTSAVEALARLVLLAVADGARRHRWGCAATWLSLFPLAPSSTRRARSNAGCSDGA